VTRLPEHEYRLLDALAPDSARSVAELVGATGLDQSLLMAAARTLSERGLVSVREEEFDELLITPEGASASEKGFPERVALRAIVGAGGAVPISGLAALVGQDDVRAEMKWLTRKGWCARDSGTLVVTDKGKSALDAPGPDERLIAELAQRERATTDELTGFDVKAALELLRGREEFVKRKRRKNRSVELTGKGAALRAGGIAPAEEVTQLTPELLASGRWREVVFKRYDVQLAAAPRYPGKPHPLQRVIQEVRRAFLEMGFEEVESPVVETAFWDFDALFQPQDHPAREMQDTFYMKSPAAGRLPDDELVRRVARAHEDGGDTGSVGWRYRWDAEKARRLVLRTHTTAATIRALSENPAAPRKVFSVGKVFRRENVDLTHLPEFIQIDGIIIDEDANLATLMGTLSEFYLKMGAQDVKFRPSFFPYTEPSAEAFARIAGLGWVEMCGSGVFRPEVTIPLGCRTPVVAWGGGLERVAMLRYGLDDIRKLYWADVDWLKEAKLCR